jgi:dGTPase
MLTLGAFMKYPKRVYLKPTKNIADKKIWFFQTDKAFEEVAQDMGLIPNKSGLDMGFERHPLAYLVEADDICYTIILKME